MNEVATLDLADPGAGKRLGEGARTALAGEIRGWRRSSPGAVLLLVRGDAWHHAPDLRDTDPAALDRASVDADYQSLVKSLFGLHCPVVISLDGHVSGFGLALATAADVRFATTATTLSVGDAKTAALLGGASWLVARAAGAGTFEQLAWTGATLRAEDAERRGLLSCTTDPGAATALAERLAADPAGSSALKRAMTSRRRAELDVVLDYESWLADVAAGGQA
jgi:enoyl-CoA hydratase/carnithine racemase